MASEPAAGAPQRFTWLRPSGSVPDLPTAKKYRLAEFWNASRPANRLDITSTSMVLPSHSTT